LPTDLNSGFPDKDELISGDMRTSTDEAAVRVNPKPPGFRVNPRWPLACLLVAAPLVFFAFGVALPMLHHSRVTFCEADMCNATAEALGYVLDGPSDLSMCGDLIERVAADSGVVYGRASFLAYNPSLVTFVITNPSVAAIAPAMTESFGRTGDTPADSVERGAYGGCESDEEFVLPALSWSRHTMRCVGSLGVLSQEAISNYASGGEVAVLLRGHATVAPVWARWMAVRQQSDASNEYQTLPSWRTGQGSGGGGAAADPLAASDAAAAAALGCTACAQLTCRDAAPFGKYEAALAASAAASWDARSIATSMERRTKQTPVTRHAGGAPCPSLLDVPAFQVEAVDYDAVGSLARSIPADFNCVTLGQGDNLVGGGAIFTTTGLGLGAASLGLGVEGTTAAGAGLLNAGEAGVDVGAASLGVGVGLGLGAAKILAGGLLGGGSSSYDVSDGEGATDAFLGVAQSEPTGGGVPSAKALKAGGAWWGGAVAEERTATGSSSSSGADPKSSFQSGAASGAELHRVSSQRLDSLAAAAAEGVSTPARAIAAHAGLATADGDSDWGHANQASVLDQAMLPAAAAAATVLGGGDGGASSSSREESAPGFGDGVLWTRAPWKTEGGEEAQVSLAFTRYCFTSRLLCTINHPFIAPSHLHCLHYCNTVVRLLRNIRRPPDPPFVALHHTILVVAISCKGQR